MCDFLSFLVFMIGLGTIIGGGIWGIITIVNWIDGVNCRLSNLEHGDD